MPSRIDIGPEGGPFVAVNENNNDLELQDINGNVIAKWDETAGHWDFANNSLTNLAAVETSNLTVTDSIDATGLSLSGTATDPTQPFEFSGADHTVTEYATDATVNGDNSPTELISFDDGTVARRGATFIFARGSDATTFTDLVLVSSIGNNVSVVGQSETSVTRSYSLSGNVLQISIDNAGETYNVASSVVGGHQVL